MSPVTNNIDCFDIPLGGNLHDGLTHSAGGSVLNHNIACTQTILRTMQIEL